MARKRLILTTTYSIEIYNNDGRFMGNEDGVSKDKLTAYLAHSEKAGDSIVITNKTKSFQRI